jgi:branched-chain amino acid transport system substrate-binding protein
MIKAGVLYPQSGIYPLLGADFLSGIKASLAFHGLKEKIQLIPDPVGFGNSEKEVYQKVEHLLLMEGADIIIGFLDLKVIGVVKPLFTATGKLFIVVNPGANYPENWVAHPTTIFLTLLDSFLCRLTGIMAARDGDTKAIMAASFYDGGYQHCNSFIKGFAGEGGSIHFNFISPQKIKDFNIISLEDFIHNNPEIKSLLCLFSGEEASLFYKSLNKVPGAGSLQLYVSPMMLEEDNCLAIKERINNQVKGFIPWHSSLDNENNLHFKKNIVEHSGRKANVFSLLGWEAGLVLALKAENDIEGNAGEKIVRQLHITPIKSPRGLLQTDELSNYLIGPVIKAGLDAAGQVVVHDTIDNISTEWKRFMNAEESVVASGWLNTYLCH